MDYSPKKKKKKDKISSTLIININFDYIVDTFKILNNLWLTNYSLNNFIIFHIFNNNELR